ncbi:hypothetical protein AGOR_G00126060 [Albula goreensis]|uniref:Uncharacterized protein n=1 Tax=Albula goreensis TaxID=1534307 RepID=A0A8T3DDR2_9TELE|nr:hypothetical protein AGOR_G00126060 [Albula goreensis]
MKTEADMERRDCSEVKPISCLERSEDTVEGIKWKTGYRMSREEQDILANMKKEVDEEGWERQSVKVEEDDDIKEEEGTWTEQKRDRDELSEVKTTNQVLKSGGKIEGKRECGQKKGDDLSFLLNSLLLKQPRVLIHRLEIADISYTLSLPSHSISSKRNQGMSSSLRKHEPSTVRSRRSLKQKRKKASQLERQHVALSENRMSAEASHSCPVIFSRNQNTGQTLEMLPQVFTCSQCPFVHKEEVNLHQHIDKVHVEECSRRHRKPRKVN